MTGFVIHVIDTNPDPVLTDLENVTSVPKYVISDEKYAAKKNNFRDFKKDMKKKNPNFGMKEEIVADYQKEEAEAIAVESRCETLVGKKRATVKYVGKVASMANGYWIGI